MNVVIQNFPNIGSPVLDLKPRFPHQVRHE